MNPNLNALLSSIRVLLITIGGVMATKGLENTGAYFWVMTAAGSTMVVGPAVWGVWSAFATWRKASAVGVAAGINMTIQGKAVAEDGTVISKFGADADATPPKPVTEASGAEIVAKFAPTTPPAKA